MQSKGQSSALTLENFAGVFAVLCGGLILASITAICEISYHVARKRQRYKNMILKSYNNGNTSAGCNPPWENCKNNNQDNFSEDGDHSEESVRFDSKPRFTRNRNSISFEQVFPVNTGNLRNRKKSSSKPFVVSKALRINNIFSGESEAVVLRLLQMKEPLSI